MWIYRSTWVTQLQVVSYFCDSIICTPPSNIKTLIGHTVKPVLNGHPKIDKTKVLKTNGSLMKVESIAECSLGQVKTGFTVYTL